MNSTEDEARRVVVLMGGRSAEREVSLNTGAQVAQALCTAGAEVIEIDAASADFIEQVRLAAPDAVFICLHGRYGEDGTVQGLLELLDIPYVGSGVLASALAMDKVMSKHFFDHAGPAHTRLRRGSPRRARRHPGDHRRTRPAHRGEAGQRGLGHRGDDLTRARELPAAIDDAFRHDDTVLVERFVSGVEVTVGVLGNESPVALPTLEVVPEHEFYDYEAKYVPGLSRHIVPARVSDETNAECARIAIAVHELLGCSGMSRTDVIVAEDDGSIQILEVNTIPGMTATSLLPEAAAAAGIEFPELCSRLVDYALQ